MLSQPSLVMVPTLFLLAVQHADWDANPAEMIIGHTYHNKVGSQTSCTAAYADNAHLSAMYNINRYIWVFVESSNTRVVDTMTAS